MKIVASLIVRNERHRYLEACLDHLLEFCDEIRVVDDGSTDGVVDGRTKRTRVLRLDETTFYRHEGDARNTLLRWTLEAEPTHVLAIDADEFVEDGPGLRDMLQHDGDIWPLRMVEIWEACDDRLCERVDGQWATGSAQAWRVPPNPAGLRIPDRALASGRIPEQIAGTVGAHRMVHSGIGMLHFGWANEQERAARYQRYVEHDGGQFHASAHLQSIMWPPGRIGLKARSWPPALAAYEARILRTANRGAA